MTAKGQLLQDPFLNALRKEHIPVSIYLVNGIKLAGTGGIVRPVRGSVAQYRDANGLQARHFDGGPGAARQSCCGARSLSVVFQVDSERAPNTTRALLVSVAIGRRDDPDSAEELKQLVVSADIEPVGFVSVRRDRPDAAYFIGSGKVEELKSEATAADASLVIFDIALSPAQQRNLEQTLGIWVLDRTALILYIFSQRARSREGKLQVELAQLEHLSTRLVRGWSHLERQRGGLGKTGGPGEKQIELDRRMIGAKVRRLRDRLKQSEKQRRTRRRARSRNAVVSISLVGYTNAGKSTLFNALTQAGVYAADQLFATLDTTARKCRLSSRCERRDQEPKRSFQTRLGSFAGCRTN